MIMLRCPQCASSSKQAVLETRPAADGGIARRRRCSTCGYAFRTVEQLSEAGLQVRKVDGRVVPFVRDSIRTNIKRAASERLESKLIDDLVDGVVADVYPLSEDGPIRTQRIADAVLKRLRQVDPATHIRFGIVHAGRQDRQDGKAGWRDIDEVRAWLAREYPGVREASTPGGLSEVVKRDGRLVPFDRAKLERGIGIASKGRGSHEEVGLLASSVADDVVATLRDQPVVTSGQIAAEILRGLRCRDSVAYLRFAGTVKRFSSAAAYESEAFALRSVGAGSNPALI
jgi:transcriptional repressor NrdR